jgi:hypothetical protein
MTGVTWKHVSHKLWAGKFEGGRVGAYYSISSRIAPDFVDLCYIQITIAYGHTVWGGEARNDSFDVVCLAIVVQIRGSIDFGISPCGNIYLSLFGRPQTSFLLLLFITVLAPWAKRRHTP